MGVLKTTALNAQIAAEGGRAAAGPLARFIPETYCSRAEYTAGAGGEQSVRFSLVHPRFHTKFDLH